MSENVSQYESSDMPFPVDPQVPFRRRGPPL